MWRYGVRQSARTVTVHSAMDDKNLNLTNKFLQALYKKVIPEPRGPRIGADIRFSSPQPDTN